MQAKKPTQKFSAAERKAMKERVAELKADETTVGEGAVLAKIAKMQEPDRSMATRIHEIVKTNAPTLTPKLWYGMPAWAKKDGKVVCFFQDALKFKSRYATLGFSDKANLDDGSMWPVAFALKKLTASEEKKIAALIKQAIK